MLRNGYVGDFGPEFLAGTAEYGKRCPDRTFFAGA